MELEAYLSEKRRVIDTGLEEYLPPGDGAPIRRAMRYSVLDGGKRIRPILVLAGCEAVGGSAETALPTACAIEFIHTYSLIHDDLPAMDNDDFRRGKPTSHKVFGEAMAILAGDALLTLAFETLTRDAKGLPADLLLRVVHRIASAAGVGGMIAGQALDLSCEGKEIDPETLEFIHGHKTGALIEASVVAGGTIGRGTDEQIESLSLYGQKIGLAFQITDDILDFDGGEKKATYPGIYGLEKSKALAVQAVDGAVEALRGFDERADPLRAIARFIAERKA
jgi:geranylgeranyl diphosphate synthase type II